MSRGVTIEYKNREYVVNVQRKHYFQYFFPNVLKENIYFLQILFYNLTCVSENIKFLRL